MHSFFGHASTGSPGAGSAYPENRKTDHRRVEEAEILQAIEDERARQSGESDDPSSGSEREGGDYVM